MMKNRQWPASIKGTRLRSGNLNGVTKESKKAEKATVIIFVFSKEKGHS